MRRRQSYDTLWNEMVNAALAEWKASRGRAEKSAAAMPSSGPRLAAPKPEVEATARAWKSLREKLAKSPTP